MDEDKIILRDFHAIRKRQGHTVRRIIKSAVMDYLDKAGEPRWLRGEQ